MNTLTNVATVACAAAIFLLGCTTPHRPTTDVSYRSAQAADGVTQFTVSINGKQFRHSSDLGIIEFYTNRDRSILIVRITSGIGTFVGGDVDYYYHVDPEGRVSFMGSLKSTWFRGESEICAELKGFRKVRDIPCRD